MPLFDIAKASSCSTREQREIDTIEGLLNLIKEFGHDIVIGVPDKNGCDYFVTIYDDYLE